MRDGTLKGDLLLVLTAAIWGTGFVAQRAGMDHVGPFVFNGVRFALGSMALLPVIWLANRSAAVRPVRPAPVLSAQGLPRVILVGVVLFAAASLQQTGMVHTSAGKGGFITGLYVILVPIAGLLWRQRPSAGTWAGAVMAMAGLCLLSVREGLYLERGDSLVLASAFLWAAHVLLIGWLSPLMDPIRLAASQFAVCSVLSLAAAFIAEAVSIAGILAGTVPILYGGLLSVGVAYTLQVVAQRHAPPAHASVILSLEGVFAALGGWVVLGEVLDRRSLAGCGLMLGGMILSEVWGEGKGRAGGRRDNSRFQISKGATGDSSHSAHRASHLGSGPRST